MHISVVLLYDKTKMSVHGVLNRFEDQRRKLYNHTGTDSTDLVS